MFYWIQLGFSPQTYVLLWNFETPKKNGPGTIARGTGEVNFFGGSD